MLWAVALVVLLAWANVGLAGQKDRLRERVRALNERVVALEIKTKNLTVGGDYVGLIDGRRVLRQCPDESPAKWTAPVPGDWAFLSC